MRRFRIEDRTDECAVEGSRIRHRELTDIRFLMLHRIDPSDEAIGVPDEAVALGRWFEESFGWSHPYTFYVRRSGLIEQTRLLVEITPHAWKRNRECLAIGASGNFQQRGESPTAQQVEAVRWLVRWLSLLIVPSVPLVDHDALEDASKDADKVCPGPKFSAADVRRVVTHDMQAEARYVLRNAGLRI